MLTQSSHITEGDYAIFMETSNAEGESWYSFIRVKDNLDALNHLQSQLEQVDWYISEDLSMFDLDLSVFVSAKTAKEMTKVQLNSYTYHAKYDGKLEMINLGFKSKDDTEKKMERAFNVLGYGQLENFIDDEDIDEEDIDSSEFVGSDISGDTSESDSGSDSDSDSDSGSESEDGSKSEDEEQPNLPASLTNIPPRRNKTSKV